MIVMIVMAAIAYRSDMLDSASSPPALAGACVGFLWFNSFPADIFMGDTGSLALGMALGCLAVFTKSEFIVLVIGGLFVAEALSVMIQVFYYKKTHKRIFLMAPAPSSFREEGLVRNEGRRALLDRLRRAGRARLRRVLRRNLDGGGIGYGEPEDACRQETRSRKLGPRPRARSGQVRPRCCRLPHGAARRPRGPAGRVRRQPNAASDAYAGKARDRGAIVEFGEGAVDRLAQACGGHFELCIASPGISEFSDLYRSAAAVSDEVVSEVELAWRESDDSSTWVAVTGTNGKTTVTALTNHLLRAAGMASAAVGNIGDTCISAVAAGETDVYVAEVSSYQLTSTKLFAPNVAVLLNITPDHLHWHHTLENYAAAKMKVLDNLSQVPGSVAVMDASNDVVRAEVRRLRSIDGGCGFAIVPMGTAEGLQGRHARTLRCRQRRVHQRRRRARRGPSRGRSMPSSTPIASRSRARTTPATRLPPPRRRAGRRRFRRGRVRGACHVQPARASHRALRHRARRRML